jgi:hypothetical protein
LQLGKLVDYAFGYRVTKILDVSMGWVFTSERTLMFITLPEG